MQANVDAFVLAFITEHTRLPVDGPAHRALVAGILDMLEAQRRAERGKVEALLHRAIENASIRRESLRESS